MIKNIMKNIGVKKDVSGADVLNNEYYKDDVRTEEGEKKILSETKTEVLKNKIRDLEILKQKNGGKLGVQGEKSLQLAKEELLTRNPQHLEDEEKQETEFTDEDIERFGKGALNIK